MKEETVEEETMEDPISLNNYPNTWCMTVGECNIECVLGAVIKRAPFDMTPHKAAAAKGAGGWVASDIWRVDMLVEKGWLALDDEGKVVAGPKALRYLSRNE